MTKIKSKSTATGTRDAEATRASILDAAKDEFAQNGLAGARTEAIAARTGVTKAMIYYYFESKERLYEAVLERALQDRLNLVESLQLEQHPPQQALELYVREFLMRSAGNPNMAQILTYEAMQNKGKYYKQVGIFALYGSLAGILERGMASGAFRELDTYHAAVNIVGACVFYFCSRENIKSLWPNKHVLAEDMVQSHIEEAVKLIVNGVKG